MTCVEGQEFDDMCKVLPIGWFLVHELSKHSMTCDFSTRVCTTSQCTSCL